MLDVHAFTHIYLCILFCIGLFLGNLPSRLRSALKSIQLLTVCKYRDIVHYGIDTILEPIVESVKRLEEVRYHEMKLS